MPDRSSPRIVALPRHAWLAVLLVTLAAALVRFPGLGYPAEEYFDEVYHAKTALEYLNGQPPTEWVHPPTAKLLIAVGVALFGYEPWAWRLAPALAGTLLAPVFLLLAWRVLRRPRGALLATVLLLLDGVYLVQSRVAMTNVFAVLFQVLAALLVLRAADHVPALGRAAWRRRDWRSGWRSRRAGRASGPGAFSASSSWRCACAGPWRPATCPRGTCRREAALAALAFGAAPRRGVLPRATCPGCCRTTRWPACWSRAPAPSSSSRARARCGSSCSSRRPSGTTTPSSPRPTTTSAPGGPGRGCTAPPGTSGGRTSRRSAASSPWATRRSGGPRCRPSSGRSITGWRQRDPRRLFIAAGFCVSLPALGAVAANAQLQPLPLRGAPLRLPRPRDDPRPHLGRPRRTPRPGLRGAGGGARSSSSFRS